MGFYNWNFIEWETSFSYIRLSPAVGTNFCQKASDELMMRESESWPKVVSWIIAFGTLMHNIVAKQYPWDSFVYAKSWLHWQFHLKLGCTGQLGDVTMMSSGFSQLDTTFVIVFMLESHTRQPVKPKNYVLAIFFMWTDEDLRPFFLAFRL